MNPILNEKDKSRALDVLEKAFIVSEGMTWMLKNKSKTSLRKFLEYCFYEAATKNGVWLTNDRNGVVLFYQLTCKKTSVLNFLRKLYVLFFVTGLWRGIKAAKYKKMIDRTRPKVGWLGWLVATDPDSTGTGAAFQIKNGMFKLADQSNEPIFVETTILRVMVLYKVSGYYEYAKLKHPYNDLTIWFMRRDPHTFNK